MDNREFFVESIKQDLLGQFEGPSNHAIERLCALAMRGVEMDTATEIIRLASDNADDDLENRPARHSVGNLHARCVAFIAKAEETDE